jgi:hypothetical protein
MFLGAHMLLQAFADSIADCPAGSVIHGVEIVYLSDIHGWAL